MNLKSIPCIDKEIEFKYLDGETFILLLEKGRFFKLDKVGTDIWKLINGKRSVEDIARELLNEYDVPKVKLETDVTAFLERALKSKIIYLKS